MSLSAAFTSWVRNGLHSAPVWLVDTFANRPAANAVATGTLFLAKDTDVLYSSNGAAWSTVTYDSIAVADVSGAEATANKGAANGYAPLDASSKVPSANLPASSGVSSLAKSGSSGLTGDVTLTGGTNVTLTQAGQDISIAASASGGGIGAKLFDSTLGADTASIDTGAAGIAGGYDSLAVYMILRTSEAVTISTTNVTCNNDTGANYDREQVQATDTTVAGGGALAGTSWVIACSGASAQAGAATTVFLLCPGYAQTTFHKTFGGQLAIQDSVAGSSRIVANALRYRSTSAISRMKVAAASGNLKAGSRLLIYGF